MSDKDFRSCAHLRSVRAYNQSCKSKVVSYASDLVLLLFLSLTCCLLCMSAAYFLMHFRLDFVIEANTIMIPGQSDMGPY